MKIHVAKSAGFCFGVKRALHIALKTASSGKKVYMLGDIVHNEDVVKKIEEAGIKKLNKLTKGRRRILLVRAHGAAKAIFRKARSLGYKIVDAACPMVKEIHKIAKDMEKKGYKIIVIGDKKHDEVIGICGQLNSRALVIDDIKSINLKKLKKIKMACVVVQSTQNIEKVIKVVKILKRYIKDLEFFNTICMPTRTKQEEIKRMPLENDVMIVIGSKTSANTRRLYEISRRINKRTYWVSSKKDIHPVWFKKAKSIGVTAGASTPDETTCEVIDYLKTI